MKDSDSTYPVPPRLSASAAGAAVASVESRFSQALGAAIEGSHLSFADEGWTAPVLIVDAPSGFGEEVWNLAFPNLLSWALRGAVICEDRDADASSTTAGDARFSLQPTFRPGHYHAAGPVRFAHFYLSDALLARTADAFDLPGFKPDHLRPDLVLRRDCVLVDLLDVYRRRSLDPVDPPSRIEMEARALLVADRLIGAYHTLRRAAPARGGLAPWQLKRACEAMTAQLDGDPGLDDLAAIVGCSPTHFSRAFKQSTGLAPFHWLAKRRIEAAKRLLEENHLSLAEIALAVGFSAQPQFTTAFGRDTGMTPGAWRRDRRS